jgi:hypothetical protein
LRDQITGIEGYFGEKRRRCADRHWDCDELFSGRHELNVSPMRGAARYRGSKRKCCDATAMEVWAYPIEEHARRRLANHIEPERW